MINKKKTLVTFDVLNDMSKYLYQHQNKVSYQEVQKKVSEFLVDKGETKFLEIYNEVKVTKDFIKALDLFNI